MPNRILHFICAFVFSALALPALAALATEGPANQTIIAEVMVMERTTLSCHLKPFYFLDETKVEYKSLNFFNSPLRQVKNMLCWGKVEEEA